MSAALARRACRFVARIAWLGLPLCAACTLLELSSEIGQGQCSTDLDCDVLNMPTASGFNPCMVWQCGDDRICAVSRTDHDRDGISPLGCEPVGQGDCDDENAERAPEKLEVCDGIDNDCDLRTDEGSLGLEPSRALVFEAPLDDIDYSWSPRTGELSVAYSLRGKPNRPGLATWTGDGEQRAGALELDGSEDEPQPDSKSVSLGALNGTRRFALALVESDAPNRIWVGNAFDSDGPTLSFDRMLLQRGLRCAAGEACAAGPGMDTGPGAIPPSTAPSVAALGDQILVAYTRILGGRRDACDPPPDDELRQPALLNVLVDPDPAPPQELTNVAVKLDDLGETESPALLAVDTNLLMGDLEFGWLAAYVDRAGDLVVRRVTRELELPTKDLKRADEDAPFSNVKLTTGLVEPGRTLVGVVTQFGCGKDAGVFFGVLTVTWNSDGQPSLNVFRQPMRVDTDGGEQPSVAFNTERRNWGVAYEHDGALLVRELDLNGFPIGDAPYDLGDSGSLDFAIVPGISPAPDSFRVYSYREQDEPVLEVVQLRECSSES